MQHRRNRTRGRYTSAKLLVAGLVLYGCGSSGGGGGDDDEGTVTPPSGTTPETGLFIDSPVQGLNYTSAGGTGITEAGGGFDYWINESSEPVTYPVTFSVGGIVLGTVIPGRYVSPLDLDPEGPDSILDSDIVLNTVRLLLTLDTDSDPTVDGITIVEAQRLDAAGMSLNFDQSAWHFKNDPDVIAALNILAPGTPLVSKNYAIAHFNASMDAILAGWYSGTFEGDFAGAWEMSISNDGDLELYLTLNGGTEMALGSNAFYGDGSFVAIGIDADENGAQFNGTISEGVVEGTWTGLAEAGGTGGTFSGGLRTYGVAFVDVSAFSAIEGQPIEGSYEADDGSSGTLVLSLEKDEHGRDAVHLLVDGAAASALYPTSEVTSTTLSFKGLNGLGMVFTGVLSSTGDVSGTFFSCNRPGPVGSFSGSL